MMETKYVAITAIEHGKLLGLIMVLFDNCTKSKLPKGVKDQCEYLDANWPNLEVRVIEVPKITTRTVVG